jgi:hypothetical protein
MKRHWLVYWLPEYINYDESLWHAESNQFRLHKSRHVKADDVIWIVTMEVGRLKFIGCIAVAEVLSRMEIKRRYPEYLFERHWHALANTTAS